MTDQLNQAFREEAGELLVELESALLALDEKRDDPELVARAFRALHTIKGSGAMFGFEEMSAFAHHLENAFDRVRNGTLKPATDLINLSLAAKDQIKLMLDGEAANRAEEILAGLRRLTGVETQPRPQAEAARSVECGEPREWRIGFRPGPDTLRNGANPLLLLAELRELGELHARADISAVPKLAEIDTERCYLAWELTLKTCAAESAIRDVFIFVEGESELAIEPPAEAVRPAAGERKTEHASSTSLRVSAEKLDRLVNLVGELVTVQARLSEVAARSTDTEVAAISEEVERLTSALRENSMSIRMLPLRSTFERFRRLVHDLNEELNKRAELIIEGADTELDKTVIDHLNDPLVHLIRNAMDHGIESEPARRASGKNATARVHLSAEYSGANVLIRVSDNGRGIDPEAVRARAIERGLIGPNATLSENEILSLILAPGFSTAREITDVSGRGVGMDVVRRSVEGLRGSLEVSSKPGAGMTVTLRLPLTLAIIDGLLVRVASSYFVLPLANSLECIELTGDDIRAAHGNRIANVRGEMIPYIRLSECFEMAAERPEREQIMVVETEHGRFGFAVDQVLGDHQTVIKNLGRVYRNIQIVSGATILGNGTVALILDPQRLVQNAIREVSGKDGFSNGCAHAQINSTSRKEQRNDVT